MASMVVPFEVAQIRLMLSMAAFRDEKDLRLRDVVSVI